VFIDSRGAFGRHMRPCCCKVWRREVASSAWQALARIAKWSQGAVPTEWFKQQQPWLISGEMTAKLRNSQAFRVFTRRIVSLNQSSIPSITA